ncbi:MAG: PP2C family serine/threonine-protein phosphatase [Chloroflexota bacterium]
MIRTQQAHLPVVALSDPGMRGKNNEDRFGVVAMRTGEANATPALLAVLADGIGGHRAGEVAAEMAVNLIAAFVLENGDRLPPQELLEEAITRASQSIYEQAQTSRAKKGMGATCACVYILGHQLYTASVGDSRIYLLRGGSIRQLTTDHTWIQEALERGLITSEQVNGHPNSHVIRRFLGSPTPPQVDFRLRLNGEESDEQAAANQGLHLRDGDRLLLCSDGLTDLVSDEEILAAVENQPAQEAAAGLIALANQRGGHDNITLVLVEVPPGSLPQAGPKPARRWWVWGCVALLIVALLGGLLGGGALWLLNRAEPTPMAEPTRPASGTLQAETLLPAVTILPSPTPPLISLTDEAGTLPVPLVDSPTPTPWPTYTLQP